MNKKDISRKNKIVYEPKDDVLNIWLSDKPYDYGENDGNLVITHYTKDGEPVYIEVLFASRFFKNAGPDFYKRSLKARSKTSFSSSAYKRAKKATAKIENVNTVSVPLEIRK